MREFLLLCNRPARGSNASTIIEHIEAIHRMPGFRVREISMIGDIPAFINLDSFDSVGIHYSLHISDPTWHFLSVRAIERLARYEGHKCIWMHDEYRRTNETVKNLNKIGIDTLFTVIPQEVSGYVYGSAQMPKTKVVTVLTGYVSTELERIVTSSDAPRPIDISYRARRPPFWLGELGQEKVMIGEFFIKNSRDLNINIDISVEEADRLYGIHWLKLLIASRAALSSESGASVIDFTGELEKSVEEYVRRHPHATFADVRNMTDPFDKALSINCISPRIFEMAACRTAIVAFPGEYSGIIQPWVHYIPLEKNFSNFPQIIQAINDPKIRKAITERAYKDLIASGNYSYEKFSLLCASSLDVPNRTKKPIISIIFFLQLYLSPNYILHRLFSILFQRCVLALPLRRWLVRGWLILPHQLKVVVRPFFRIIGR